MDKFGDIYNYLCGGGSTKIERNQYFPGNLMNFRVLENFAKKEKIVFFKIFLERDGKKKGFLGWGI